MENPKRYHPVIVTLHWLVALGIFFNMYLGIFVFSQHRRGSFQWEPIHIVIGATILALMLVRLAMRFLVKRPADATAGYKLFDILAKVVHYGLYLTVLTVTVLGLIFTAQSGELQSAFTGSRPEFNGPPPGFNNSQSGGAPSPGTFPNDGGRPPGGDFRGGFGLQQIHGLIAYLLALLLVIHILAALYHQFIRKDNLLARMWYGSR